MPLKKKTQQRIKKLKSKEVVGCKLFFKVKYGIPGVEPKRSKVRLVTKEFTKKKEIDLTEVF